MSGYLALVLRPVYKSLLKCELEMKKFYTVIFAAFLFLPSMAQSNVDFKIKQFESELDKNAKAGKTREYYLDLPARVTKVVLAGDNSMADLIFKNAIEKGWNISPFEFCDYEEFDRLKCDTNYYFLLRVDVEPKKAGVDMEFMTYIKGSEKAVDGIEKMPELISLPMFDKEDKTGRVFTYMPAYVNIMQNYLQKIVDGKIYPELRRSIKTNDIEKAADRRILFCKEDLAYDYTVNTPDIFSGHAEVVSYDVAENAIVNGMAGSLVSLVVSPSEPVKGAHCYKMLISTDTYELYYYQKHKITRKKGIGFIKRDIKKLSMPFRLINRAE